MELANETYWNITKQYLRNTQLSSTSHLTSCRQLLSTKRQINGGGGEITNEEKTEGKQRERERKLAAKGTT